jgi:hypothetical protein
MHSSKPRSSLLVTVGSIFLAIIFVREIAVHWQLANNGHPELVECSAALQDAQKEIATLRNRTNSPLARIEGLEARHAQQEANPVQQSPPAQEGGQQVPSTALDIFRRFVLQPPAPAKVPYNLNNKVATHFSQSGQDKKIDELLKQREKGFFIEV